MTALRDPGECAEPCQISAGKCELLTCVGATERTSRIALSCGREHRRTLAGRVSIKRWGRLRVWGIRFAVSVDLTEAGQMPQEVPVNVTAVWKTAVPSRVPGVRIPPHPLPEDQENVEKRRLVHGLVPEIAAPFYFQFPPKTLALLIKRKSGSPKKPVQ